MILPELEHFRSNTEIPKTVNLNKALCMVAMEQFNETNISRIKTYKGDLSKHPSYWHLMELVKVVKEQDL